MGYHVDDPKARYHVPMNKVREAMAYLTYIIDHFGNLPSVMAFIHPHKEGYPLAWHTEAGDHDNTRSLNSLRLDFVQDHGYANLRRLHDPGCPAEIQPFRDPPDQDRKAEIATAETWLYMFGQNSKVPSVIAAPCCSQFAVSRGQVLTRPKADYLRYRDWIFETTLPDDVSGRTLE